MLFVVSREGDLLIAYRKGKPCGPGNMEIKMIIVYGSIPECCFDRGKPRYSPDGEEGRETF